VEDSREPGLGASLKVGGTADNDAGQRERAEGAAEGIAYPLRQEFTVEVGPRAGVEAVHGDGAEQAFSARHKGHAGDGGEHGGIGEGGKGRRRREADRLP
jgi:hypothetical protein